MEPVMQKGNERTDVIQFMTERSEVGKYMKPQIYSGIGNKG